MMAIWRRKFTLVELIVAMTLVSTIMLVLFSFLASSQRTWSLSDSAARIYRNSRTAFNIIERDLQCIVNSAVPNREIGLHVFGPTPTDANDALHACLVASTGPLEGAYSRLCEITYKHHVDPGDPATQYYLTRQHKIDRCEHWNAHRHVLCAYQPGCRTNQLLSRYGS